MVFAIIMSIINLKLYYVCTSLHSINRTLTAALEGSCFVIHTVTAIYWQVHWPQNTNILMPYYYSCGPNDAVHQMALIFSDSSSDSDSTEARDYIEPRHI